MLKQNRSQINVNLRFTMNVDWWQWLKKKTSQTTLFTLNRVKSLPIYPLIKIYNSWPVNVTAK